MKMEANAGGRFLQKHKIKTIFQIRGKVICQITAILSENVLKTSRIHSHIALNLGQLGFRPIENILTVGVGCQHDAIFTEL